MSLATNIQNLATRIASEFKTIRVLITGSGTGDTQGLTTVSKNLVGAVNEVKGLVGAGSPTTINDLTDVTIAGPLTGHLLRYNAGTGQWENALGTTYFDAAGAAAAAQAAAIAASQPVDADLSAIAALQTTAYGRAFLALVDQAALMGLMRASTTALPGVVPLATVVEATTGTDTTKAVTAAGVAAVKAALKNEILGAGVPAALDTLDELAAALGDDANFAATVTNALGNKQPLDADLTALAALVSAADKLPYATGAGTWALTTLTAVGRSLLDDPDVATMRATLSVYSQAEIGDPATNFVDTFNAGLL